MPKFTPETLLEGLAEAVPSILAETVDLALTLEERRTETHPLVTEGVTVLVGVLGDLEGYVLLSMSPEWAVRFTSAFTGMEIEAYDEIVDSAIGELGNMVTGQASILLHRQGVDCDLCPPTILLSEKVELGGQASEILAARFTSEWGDVHARIALGTPAFEGEKGPPNPAHSATQVTPTLSRIIRTDQFLDEVTTMLEAGEVERALTRVQRIDELQFEVAPRLPAFLVESCARLADALPREDRQRILEKALALSPEHREAHVALGHLHREAGRTQDALDHMTRALALGTTDGETCYWVGVLEHERGERGRAVRALEHALRHGAGDEARELLERLKTQG